MDLLTDMQLEQLRANGIATKAALASGTSLPDHWPVVKLINAYSAGTWLLSEQDTTDPDIFYGISDLGYGESKKTSVSMSELSALTAGPLQGMKAIKRADWFIADRSLDDYLAAARESGEL